MGIAGGEALKDQSVPGVETTEVGRAWWSGDSKQLQYNSSNTALRLLRDRVKRWQRSHYYNVTSMCPDPLFGETITLSPPEQMDRCDGKAKQWEEFRDPSAMKTLTDKECFERRT